MDIDGEQLRRLRVERSLSLRDLANRASMTQDNIWKIENRVTRRPHPTTVLRLAEALEVDPEALASSYPSVRGELLHVLFQKGWIPAETTIVPGGGVIVRFRDAPYTSDWSGMKTRHAAGVNDLDAYRVLLTEIEREQQANDPEYDPDPKSVTLSSFPTHEAFWAHAPESQRSNDIMYTARDLARKYAGLGYENQYFRMHPETGRFAVARWVQSSFLDRMPNIAVERIHVVCNPHHERDYVSISVAPLEGDEFCL